MSSADGSDNIETAPPPAVSSLRSKFERLAADSSTAPSTLKPSSSHLTASPVPPSPRLSASPIPPSPRLRPTFEHDREPSDSSIHSLRLASSSSDLKAPTKRPPPPPPQRPPSRAPSPAPPRSSPLLRPVFDTAQPNVDQDTSVDILAATPKASLARRPPPPPPQEHRSPGVPSLIKQFGCLGTPCMLQS
ncbi:hypothetical protein C8Q80DRAFT_597945 [Daedaleopsis nitida]|nr:hypothetical protein C8Q80DRAFT_597945 [Daedaleopsis nitida]